MYRQLSIIICFLLMGAGTVFSQENRDPRSHKPIGIQVSYFGESAYHPGFRVGTSFYLKEGNKEFPVTKKSGKEFTKVRRNIFMMEAGMGLYHHPNNRKMLFFHTDAVYQFMTTRGFFTELKLGIGYMRSFYNTQTFTLNEQGEIEEIKRGGRSKFMPAFTPGFGVDISARGGAPMAWFIRFPQYFEVPYNHTGVYTLALETGLTLFIGKRHEN